MHAHLRHSHTVGSRCARTVRPGRLETAHSQSKGVHMYTYIVCSQGGQCVRMLCVSRTAGNSTLILNLMVCIMHAHLRRSHGEQYLCAHGVSKTAEMAHSQSKAHLRDGRWHI
jgi:hypothetical protein